MVSNVHLFWHCSCFFFRWADGSTREDRQFKTSENSMKLLQDPISEAYIVVVIGWNAFRLANLNFGSDKLCAIC
jgi:hypothetical protein